MKAVRRLCILAAALWWGSLTALGTVVVPLLFRQMETPALAGNLAGKLFSAQTWVSVACAIFILLAARTPGEAVRPAWARWPIGLAIAGLLAALLVEFAVAPRILAREDLRLWHGMGSALFALQWACAGLALWKLSPDGPS